MVDNVNPTSQFHPYRPETSTPAADSVNSTMNTGLGGLLGALGVVDRVVADGVLHQTRERGRLEQLGRAVDHADDQALQRHATRKSGCQPQVTLQDHPPGRAQGDRQESAAGLVGGALGFFVPYLPLLLVAFLLFFYYRVRRRRGRKYGGLRILGD